MVLLFPAGCFADSCGLRLVVLAIAVGLAQCRFLWLGGFACWCDLVVCSPYVLDWRCYGLLLICLVMMLF